MKTLCDPVVKWWVLGSQPARWFCNGSIWGPNAVQEIVVVDCRSPLMMEKLHLYTRLKQQPPQTNENQVQQVREQLVATKQKSR